MSMMTARAAVDCERLLSEAGCEIYRPDFVFLSEEAKVQVTNDTLAQMMKFITDKYNSIDFGEIEKSAGDISRFRYTTMILENLETLHNVYARSTDPGAKSYVEVVKGCSVIMSHLHERRREYSMLYKAGNGVAQLTYTSLVAAVIYCVGVLVSNTIRFVTVEQDTGCQVLYDEIPGSMKNVHIRNVIVASRDINRFNDMINAYVNKGAIQESVSASAVAIGTIVGVFFGIPWIINLIREIIYSVYFTRVKLADMLAIQVDLINTNIESLEGRGSDGKVIARQRRIAEQLERLKNRIAVKIDTVNALVNTQKQNDAKVLRVDRNSQFVQDPGSFSGDLML